MQILHPNQTFDQSRDIDQSALDVYMTPQQTIQPKPMQRTLSKGWVGNSRASLNRSTNKKVNNLMDKSLYKDVSETLPVPSGKWYDPRKTTIQYYQNNLDQRLAQPKRLNSKFNTNYESRKIPIKK